MVPSSFTVGSTGSGVATTSGTPVDTTSVMTLDLRTVEPASGLWLSTVPAGCSLACSIVRMDRVSPLTSLRAYSMVLPVRLGTWLSLLTSERLTYRMTVESPSTVSPAAGWV